MMSNFQKKRGYMDVNRMLRAPTFNPDRSTNQQNIPGQSGLHMGAPAQLSSTGMINAGMQQEVSQNTQVIWGTNISANETQQKLKSFINSFNEINEDSDNEDDEQYTKPPFYFEKLKELKELEETVLEVDCDHIY